MDRIQKFVRKLSVKEAQKVLETITLIRTGQLDGLDTKKLRGGNDAYRVRRGKIRIKFFKTNAGNVITEIDFRNDNTYS